MNARPIAAVVLLLTFPVSTFAQTPSAHLDLKSITIATEDARPARVVMPNLSSPRPVFSQAAAATQSCAESEARGRADADLKPLSKSWFYGGMAAGAVVGILGIGGSTAAAASVKPKPKKTPQGLDASCYASGFGSKARHENVRASLFGSLIGTAAWFAFYALSSNY